MHGLRQQSLKYKTMPYIHSETSSVKLIKHFKENLTQAVVTGRLLILIANLIKLSAQGTGCHTHLGRLRLLVYHGGT